MTVRSADADWTHLYPPFREKLRQVLEDAGRATGDTWRITEGYRSPERQLWLYSQGRTRPGRIVTWMRTPRWHGTGLAADVLSSRRGYGAPMSFWKALRRVYTAAGLENPAWGNGDLGHVQLTDPALRAKSLLWVRAGFPATPGPDPASPVEVTVMVNGHPVPDADAFIRNRQVWLALRPVTDALDLVIVAVQDGAATLATDDEEFAVPVDNRDGRGFSRARDLPARVAWDADARTVSLTRALDYRAEARTIRTAYRRVANRRIVREFAGNVCENSAAIPVTVVVAGDTRRG